MLRGDITRCVNLDWLEVYCLESNERFPCNADYYRSQGYNVREREYGTRVYKEMFEILNNDGDPIIEVRRNPKSGQSDFNGLLESSTHIRLPNWMLYQGNPINFLREFLVANDYIFKRIFRIDIAYDFERFDDGTNPQKFLDRVIKKVYRKVNQAEINTHGKDGWNSYKWNSVSWGSRTSMVSTKMYNKSLELREGKNDKPWIKTAWMINGLVDNPVSMTKRNAAGELVPVTIWRVEFSMKSAADGWIVVEFVNGKRQKKQRIPHRLEMFETPDKLWQRFQDLAYNYFRFKISEQKKQMQGVAQVALSKVHSDSEENLKRKDRCRDKILFYFDAGRTFHRLDSAPAKSTPTRTEDILLKRLKMYRETHYDERIQQACTVLIQNIERVMALKFIPLGDDKERRALQIALQRHLNGDEKSTVEILEEVLALIDKDEIF